MYRIGIHDRSSQLLTPGNSDVIDLVGMDEEIGASLLHGLTR